MKGHVMTERLEVALSAALRRDLVTPLEARRVRRALGSSRQREESA
jgi:hypothetical protein